MKMRRLFRFRLRKFINFIIVFNVFVYLYLIGSSITGDDLTAEKIATEVIRKAIGPKGSNASLLVLPGETTAIFQPKDFSYRGKGKDVNVLFVVISASGNWDARDAIRSNLIAGVHGFNNGRWPGDTGRKNLVLFFTGVSADVTTQRKLEEKAEVYGDIVIDSMLDNYLNLTVKILRMFKWILSNCPNIKFLLKIDDDVHLNLSKFYEFLNQVRTEDPGRGDNLIAGHVFRGNNKPIRTVSGPYGKWFCPQEVWTDDVYPDYVSGLAYLLGVGALGKIYIQSLSTPLMHLEDVFITGIIGNKALGLKLIGISEIHLFWSVISPYFYSSCALQESFLIHSISPHTIRCWRYLNRKEFKCSNWPVVFMPC